MTTSPSPAAVERLADGLLLTRLEGGVAELRIDRPEARNALSVAIFAGLTAFWKRVDDDATINAVILTSSDCGTFCAGMDLKEAARLKQETGRDIMAFIEDPFQRTMRSVKKPLIAAMTGSFTAGGMMLSLMCDLRIGLAGTQGGIAEVKVGRGSPWAVPLLWMMPQPVLMEMTLTGDFMPIERLHRIGFVNDVAATPDEVRARALALAQRIAENAPLSVRAGKESLMHAAAVGAEQGLDDAVEIYRKVYTSEDAQEGMRAFAEKRKPRWQGR
ncbi:enoyl-CoA hydratase/isomerase family protein [Ramlibacter sp.]|uniref:enoyl-CoA hydratase/isomerase family protein n=1 Tax=Ramlibacter sp. TaxID=1917967 RepID=UPI003D143394